MNKDKIIENTIADFLCYLLDNHEGEPLYEKGLQEIGTLFLKSKYNLKHPCETCKGRGKIFNPDYQPPRFLDVDETWDEPCDITCPDCDGLDNRKQNLRICTGGDNQHNQEGGWGKTSQYKGVCWHKRSQKWHASIRNKGHLISLGDYDGEEEAAKVYDNKAMELFKEFACLNFPVCQISEFVKEWRKLIKHIRNTNPTGGEENLVKELEQALAIITDRDKTIEKRDKQIARQAKQIKQIRESWQRQEETITDQATQINGMEEAIGLAIGGIDALSENWPKEVQKDMLAIKQTLEQYI